MESEGKVRCNWELIPTEKEGGIVRGRAMHQVLIMKTKRPRVRLTTKIPIRALMNANAAPFWNPRKGLQSLGCFCATRPGQTRLGRVYIPKMERSEHLRVRGPPRVLESNLLLSDRGPWTHGPLLSA